MGSIGSIRGAELDGFAPAHVGTRVVGLDTIDLVG
jgi:hypothetical protein